MTPEVMPRYPGLAVTLRDGRAARVRWLSPADGEALAAFYASVPRRDLRFYFPHPLDREHALRKAGQAHDPLSAVLVLELADGRIGGYAWHRWERPDAEHSGFGICVAPDCQGCGAGRLLVTRLLEIARELGPPVMRLTVQLANARAVALYRSVGFVPVREQMVKHHPSLGFADEPEYAMERRTR